MSFTYDVTDGEFNIATSATLDLVAVEDNPYADYAIQGTTESDFLYGSFFRQISIFGNDGNDYILGGRRSDRLAGGDDNDWLSGWSGADLLNGDAGNDYLYGGSGADTLDGGSGLDHIWGGFGRDNFIFREGNDVDIIEDFSQGGRGWSWWGWGRRSRGDTITIDVNGVDSFDDLLELGAQQGRNTVFDFGEGDQLIVDNTRLSHLGEDSFDFI